MRDWSLHLLDLMENCLRAEAKTVGLDVRLAEDGALDITLSDDGKGMPEDFLKVADSPFATTRTSRKLGFGLPLARQSAEATGGFLRLDSVCGQGTQVTIRTLSSHIDSLPLGRLDETLAGLIYMNPLRPDFVWDLRSPQGAEHFSTVVIRQVLGSEIALNEPDVMEYLKGLLYEQCQSVFGGILL